MKDILAIKIYVRYIRTIIKRLYLNYKYKLTIEGISNSRTEVKSKQLNKDIYCFSIYIILNLFV